MCATSISEKLEEVVLDENDIVTYKWVSRRWGVHTNVAKTILRDFHAEQKKLGRQLFCWYSVVQRRSVKLVPETKLKGFLSSGATVHIYAVLRSRAEDPSVVYMGDMYSVCKDNADMKNSSIAPLKNNCS